MRRQTWLIALVAGTVVAGCGIPEEQYNKDIGRLKSQLRDTEAERSKVTGLHETLTGEHETLGQRHASCLRELTALKSRGEELDAGLEQALQRINGLEKVVAKQQAVFTKLRGALDSLIKAGKLSVSIVRGQFTVQMADRILFDSGKARLKPEAQDTLRELAIILTGVHGRLFQVAGHTDSQGNPNFNWRLSGNRSLAVLDFMISEGMPADRISYAGFGQYQPTAGNETPDEMAQNRRIEIVLVPNMQEFMEPFAQ